MQVSRSPPRAAAEHLLPGRACGKAEILLASWKADGARAGERWSPAEAAAGQREARDEAVAHLGAISAFTPLAAFPLERPRKHWAIFTRCN